MDKWISVNEKLPENGTRVLVNLTLTNLPMDTDRMVNGEWVRWRKYITHWMPLPEPPKMKGGAE